MGSPVVHFEIVGSDGPKLFSFYSDLFGWKIDANNPMSYGLVDNGGQGINGGVSGGEKPSVTFYVAVPKAQEALDRAVALGGQVVTPVTVIPGMVTMAQFADPEGNVIGIVEDAMPPA